MPSRRTVIFLVLVLAAAAFSGFWFWSAGRLESAVARWADEQRQRGYEIVYAGPEIGGFPLGLQAVFETPEMASPDGWRWRGPTLSGQAQVWDPTTIEASFPGRHFVSNATAEAAEAEITAESATALVAFGGGRLERASAELGRIEVESPALGPLQLERLAASFGPWLAPTRDRGPRMEVSGQATNVTLPEEAANPLGRKVEQLELEATLHQEIPGGEPRQALARWRDAGGKVDLHRLVLVWGPLSLEGDGSLSLDQELRPLGALTARVKGLLETIDALARAGTIESGQALAIRLAFLALGGKSNDPNAPDVELPITLQNGRLYLGPVALFRLSPVL